MKENIQAQYEAHVAFELDLIAGEGANSFLSEQVGLLWKALRNLNVPALIQRDQVLELVQRYVIDGPVTDELLDLVSAVAIRLIQSPANASAQLGELVDDDSRQALVAHALTLETLRNDLIHAAVANPLYAEIVSDLLYNGIADYLEAGTEMTKKVPGMGSLMKKGGTMLSKRVGSIEDRLRGYISTNMQGILNRSEAMLQESLTAERITEVNEEIWNAAQSLNPKIDGYVGDDEVEKFVSIGADLWRHFRGTDYFRTLVEDAVDTVLDEAKNQTVSDWIASIGVSEEMVIDELQRQWQLLAPALNENGFIEASVRARLEPFYKQL